MKNKIIIRYYQPELFMASMLFFIITALLLPIDIFWVRVIGCITSALAGLFLILHVLFDVKHGIITKYRDKKELSNDEKRYEEVSQSKSKINKP